MRLKGQKPKRKAEWTKAKLKSLKATGYEHESRVNKNSGCFVRQKKQRKTQNCSCKFTACKKLKEHKLKEAFTSFYEIRNTKKQTLNLLANIAIEEKKNRKMGKNIMTFTLMF